jgi:CheY-like chemotaxis protein
VTAEAGPTVDVLLVEDEPDAREVMVELLESEGYTVRDARDGNAALAALKGVRPSLVLLDLNMPVMDGWRFCEEVERDPELQRVPIAIVTATSVGYGRPLPFRRVDAGLLRKPIDFNRLFEMLETYCGKKSSDS